MLYAAIALAGLILGYILGIFTSHKIFYCGELEIATHEGDTYMVLKLEKEVPDVKKRRYALLRVENVSYYEN